MKIEVRSRYDASVVLSVEAGSLRLALEAAVKSRANLGGADLRGANLRGADLGGADLGGADLRGADLGDAGAVIDGVYPDRWRAVAWWRKGTLVVSVGCHTKTLAEAREYWQGKDNRREVMAFLDYAEAVARIRSGA